LIDPQSSTPRESKREEEKRCSVYTTHTTLHNNKEERIPVQIRMRRSVHKVVGNYIKKTMSYGQFYEEAAILFMDINPKEFSPLVVEKLERPRQNGVQGRMQELVCVDEFTEFVELLGRDNPDNQRLRSIRRGQFIELLKKCEKIKTWGDQLVALIEEVETYFV